MAARSSPLIQASRSPAIRPIGQNQIDPSRHGDYPVVLGEKLANSELSSKQFIGIRYNYKSKHSSPNQTTIIKQGASEKRYELEINDFPKGREPISFKYRGSIDPTPSASDKGVTSLALVFDQDRQVFVLEPISTELNFNLVSGPGQVRQYPQLPVVDPSKDEDEVDRELWGQGVSSASEDEQPDSNNPFDYRHFLDQPLPSANTPILDHRLGASPSIQPQSNPAKHVSISKPSNKSPALTGVKKPTPKPSSSKTSSQTAVHASSKKTTANTSASSSRSKSTAASKQSLKSAATISVSDDDSEDEVPLAARSVTKPQVRAPRTSKPTVHVISSPQIVFDEASGLEIDMGTPPPEPRNRGRIDPSAFASRSPSHSRSGNQSPVPRHHRSTDDSDRDMVDIEDTGDSDIEALALPPPKADPRQPGSNGPRRVSTEHQPVRGAGDEDEDEDEDVEAFAAMMEHDLAQEEESEVSEEE